MDAAQDDRLAIRFFEASKPMFDSTLVALVASAVSLQLALKNWPAILINAVPLSATSCSAGYLPLCLAASSAALTPLAQLKQLQAYLLVTAEEKTLAH